MKLVVSVVLGFCLSEIQLYTTVVSTVLLHLSGQLDIASQETKISGS